MGISRDAQNFFTKARHGGGVKYPIRYHLHAAVGLLAAVIFQPASATETPSAEQSLSPYFLVRGADASGEAFPLESTDVDVSIAGVIADA